MLLSGRLSDWSVEDLLQMLHITKKTASLHVDGAERSGVVYFDEGAIVGAEVSLGTAGDGDRDSVVEALYVLQLLDDGEFEMRNEVASSAIEPLSVSEALELAAEHVRAERSLDESGLLDARSLRLAQEIAEPIILSERVWAAVSVSIPAFTFEELERRMGRSAAVETLEQFRDLGVLEAVLDESLVDDETAASESAQSTAGGVEDTPDVDAFGFDESSPVEPIEIAGDEDEIVPITVDDTAIEPVDDTESMWMAEEPTPAEIFVSDEDREVDAPDEDEAGPAEEPRPQQPVSSLSDAIRAAAAAVPAAPRPASPADGQGPSHDDESRLLAEASGAAGAIDGDATEAAVGTELRRTVRALVAPPDTTLVQGVLDDLGHRFRTQSPPPD